MVAERREQLARAVVHRAELDQVEKRRLDRGGRGRLDGRGKERRDAVLRLVAQRGARLRAP
mgnify:CR=1 FL=1